MFVICTLPNASNEINGIPFEDHKEGKISVEAVSAETAETFAQIEGYKVVDSKKASAAAKPTAAEKAAAEAAAAEAAAAEKTAQEEADAKAAAEAQAAAEAAPAKAKK